VDRARDMYSAELFKQPFMGLKKVTPDGDNPNYLQLSEKSTAIFLENQEINGMNRIIII